MVDFTSNWEFGNGLIVNDSHGLHQRSSFLGNRHIKNPNISTFKHKLITK